MRRLERIPLHDHSDNNSGGLVAASTSVTIDVATGGGSSAEVTFGSPAATAAALADGSNSTAARSDHVHTNAYLGMVLAYGTAVAGYTLTASSAGSATWAAAGADVTLSTVAAAGTASTINVSTARTHDVTLTADCALTLTGATTAEAWYLTLFLRQDGTGGWEVTWPASVEWAAGVAPTLSTTPGDVDVITLVTLDGGTVWFGFPTGGGSSSVAALDDLTDVTITTPATDQVLTYSGGAWINAAIPTSHWEVLMTGSGTALEAVTNDAETDWLYAEV